MATRFSTLKDPISERKLFSQRIFVIGISIALLILILVARLAYLQIYQQHVYTTLARQNLLSLLPTEPNRGLIYDRNGVILAFNQPVFNLVITPNQTHNLKATINELQKVINVSNNDIAQFNKQITLQRRFASSVLRTKLTEEEIARFSVQQYKFSGVSIQTQMLRYYPQGPAFAQVVGYIGRINAKELNQVDQGNYSATNFIGKNGVEKSYEAQLHGNVGYQQAETDATGKVLRVVNATPPTPGNNLYLTIDSRLQLAAEKILGTQRGAIVAIDPRNGEVLAFVSNPSYDPNLFVTGISKKNYQQLANDPNQPLYNRALYGRYPPGSTIKPFIGLEGLASHLIGDDNIVSCPGWFKLKTSSHIYHDCHHQGHGSVNFARAIAVSCDVYFYTLASKLGIERMSQMLTKFGFGQPTGIDLSDEVSGLVPTPEWKKRTQGKSWYAGDTIITGIGQGSLLVTPLQLAAAVAALANRGTRVQPHVVLKSIAPSGETNVIKPNPPPSVELDAKDWDLLTHAMQNVTSASYGTAYKYFHGVRYAVAGKTGTAQVFSLKKNQVDKAALLPEKLRDNSLFIAFAPVDEPRIAIAVMLQHSLIPASSYARQILDDYLLKKTANN